MSVNSATKLLVLVVASIVSHAIALVFGLGLAGVTFLELLRIVGCGPHIVTNPACDLWGNVVVGAAFVACGFVFGLMQWLILRSQQIAKGGSWIVVSTFGWAIGLFASYSIYSGSRNDLTRVIAFGVAGLMPSLAQWFVLKGYVSRASWWMLANTTSAILLGLATQTEGTGVAIVLAISSVVVTGVVLVLLMQNPIPRQELQQAVNVGK